MFVCYSSKYANTKWQETSPTQHTTLSFATHNYVRKMYNMLRKVYSTIIVKSVIINLHLH